jgi:hypothetical protein
MRVRRPRSQDLVILLLGAVSIAEGGAPIRKAEIKMKIIACKTVMDEIEALKPPGVLSDYVDYALHRYPDKLRQELQRRIDSETEAEVLVFGYGLCSNGLAGLQAGDKTLVIPRVHDCISLLLGSRQEYDRLFGQQPGTYYLSKGWIDQHGDPYNEYLSYVEKYGEQTAKWVMEEQYRHYQRVAFIETNVAGLNAYAEYAAQVADFLNTKFEAIKGKPDFFSQLVSGNWQENFLIIAPGNTVRYQDFI